MQQHRRALIYASLTIACWSTVASAFKLSLSHINYLPLVFFASVSAMIMLGILCGVSGKFGQLRNWQSRDYLRSMLLGALNPTAYYLLLFRAYDLLPAQEALVLNFAWPVVLVLMGVLFLGQSMNWPGLAAISLSFFGMVIVATHGHIFSLLFSNTLGVMLALISTLVWASYWVINQSEKRDTMLRLWVNFVAGVAWMAIIMTLGHHWSLPTVQAGIGAVYIGLVEMSLGFFFWFQALRLTKNVGIINNLIFLTPFFSMLFIAHVLHETISASTLWGLLMIVSGIIAHRLWAPHRERATE